MPKKTYSSWGDCIKYILFFAILIELHSCTPMKNVVYFENTKFDSSAKNTVNKNLEYHIRKNDVISITVSSISPEVSIYNNGMIGSASSTSPASGNGYTIDMDGNLIFPKLGNIHAEGLTRRELTSRLTKDLSPYLKDPVVTVRYVNLHISVLGEVAHPQLLNLPGENITLLDALAASGDLTTTGRRDNILVIRDNEQGKEFHRLDLNNSAMVSSPYFYLRADDVVYVEPTKLKLKNNTQNQAIIGYVLSGLSIVILILDRLLK